MEVVFTSPTVCNYNILVFQHSGIPRLWCNRSLVLQALKFFNQSNDIIIIIILAACHILELQTLGDCRDNTFSYSVSPPQSPRSLDPLEKRLLIAGRKRKTTERIVKYKNKRQTHTRIQFIKRASKLHAGVMHGAGHQRQQATFPKQGNPHPESMDLKVLSWVGTWCRFLTVEF